MTFSQTQIMTMIMFFFFWLLFFIWAPERVVQTRPDG